MIAVRPDACYLGTTPVKEVRKGTELVLAPRGEELWYKANEIPSLDLRFAATKSLVDATTGTNLIDFTRGSGGTYVGSDGLIKTATTNEPRFDHDPVTGESLGLLVEEQRTNRLLYSTDFNNNYWLQSHITTNTVTGPDGTTTAATYEGTGASSSVYNTTSATVSASTQYTYSVYIKLGTMSASNYKFAVYDVSSNSFIGTDLVPAVTPTTTNWTRISYSFTTPVGCTELRVYPFRNSATITSSTVHFWGAQLEEGAFATSYIENVNNPLGATRAADVASNGGSSFGSWYQQDEGTFFAEVDSVMQSGAANTRILQVGDGTSAHRQDLAFASGTLLVFVNTANSEQVNGVTVNSAAANANARLAYAYKQDDFAWTLDAGAIKDDPTGTLPTVDRLGIGQRLDTVGYLNGHIKRLTYWGQRLPNETLQAITQ